MVIIPETIFIDFLTFRNYLHQIIRCLIVVNEFNVMLTSLTYKNRKTPVWVGNKMKAEGSVRSANILTFKVENQESLSIIE